MLIQLCDMLMGTIRTQWVPFTHGPAQYNPGYQTQQTAPPAYGGYYGANQGYGGGRQTETDMEMQQPSNVYGGHDYAPPSGPPPAKK